MFYNKYLWLCRAPCLPTGKQANFHHTHFAEAFVSLILPSLCSDFFFPWLLHSWPSFASDSENTFAQQKSFSLISKSNVIHLLLAFKYRISVASTFYFTFYHCLIIRWHGDLKTSSHLSNPDFLTFSISTPQIPQNRQFLEANSALLRRKRWTFAIRNFQLLEKCI